MKPVRRIVTGHRPDGRSTVLMDSAAPNVKQRHAGNGSTLLWVTDETPADPSRAGDRAAREIAVPRLGGEVRDNESVLRDFGIGEDVLRGHPPRHPAIHRTRTVDYVVVLEGEIDLLLDDGDVRLKAGDVVVQQGTNHAWRWCSSTRRSRPRWLRAAAETLYLAVGLAAGLTLRGSTVRYFLGSSEGWPSSILASSSSSASLTSSAGTA
jgi:mannose-6-phosphate isomerase-like protein (cupin superfamily)